MHTVKKAMHLKVIIHQCKYRYVFPPFPLRSHSFASSHQAVYSPLVFTGQQGKTTQENCSSSATRMKRLMSGSGVAKILSSLFYFIKIKRQERCLKSNRHIVGLCNRILHTPVYRLLLFYIGNAMCIFKCPEGSGIPPYIIACVTENSYDCSLSMQSGSPSTFVLPSIFPGSFQAVVRTVYTV